MDQVLTQTKFDILRTRLNPTELPISEASKEKLKPQTPEFIKGNEFPIGEGPEVVSLIKVELAGALYKVQFILKIGKTVSVSVKPDLMLKVHSLVNLIASKAKWFEAKELIAVPSSAPLH